MSELPMECRRENNVQGCNCTYEPCQRKGLCCQCLIFHRSLGELPACCFPAAVERTYDRSVERFCRVHCR